MTAPRFVIMRGETVVGHATLTPTAMPPGVAEQLGGTPVLSGTLVPAAGYAEIRDVCRRWFTETARATDDRSAQQHYGAGLEAVAQLGLRLVSASGTPVPTASVTLMDHGPAVLVTALLQT